jgi:SAM-dependent methyltransferase
MRNLTPHTGLLKYLAAHSPAAFLTPDLQTNNWRIALVAAFLVGQLELRGCRVREDHVNWFHQKLCGSELWRRRLETDLLPRTLRGVELGENLLEIGPGPGVTTDFLRRLKSKLTVLEIDSSIACALQNRLKDTNVRVVYGDGAAMPFADRSFSAVVSFTMLHHLADSAAQDHLLSEAARVLCPGGIFVGFDGIDSLLFRLAHLGDRYTPVNPDTFGTRLEAANFTEVAVEKVRRRFHFRAKL